MKILLRLLASLAVALTAVPASAQLQRMDALIGPTPSATLRQVITDETGTGALFFQGGNIGAATGTSLALGGCTIGSQAFCAATAVNAIGVGSIGTTQNPANFDAVVVANSLSTDPTKSVRALDGLLSVAAISGAQSRSFNAVHGRLLIDATSTQNFTGSSLSGGLFEAGVANGATGTISTLIGGLFSVSSIVAGAPVTTMVGARIAGVDGTGGSVTNGIGLNIHQVMGTTNSASIWMGSISSPPTGNWSIYDVTGYPMLTGGPIKFGTTASQPMLEPLGTTIRVRLADGSGDAPFSVASLVTNGGPAFTVTAVNSVSPTSPNRTITISLGGTTYYLAAKTTNN